MVDATLDLQFEHNPIRAYFMGNFIRDPFFGDRFGTARDDFAYIFSLDLLSPNEVNSDKLTFPVDHPGEFMIRESFQSRKQLVAIFYVIH
jgi:hypothetical protein